MSSYTLPCGVEVVFLYDDKDTTKLSAPDHLRVLNEFAEAWNNGDQDIHGKMPPISAVGGYPAKAIVVSSAHHRSNHSIEETMHITAYICGKLGWDLKPKRSNSCVHIYSWVQTPRNGFHSYWIKNSNANNFKSEAVAGRLQRALANHQELPEGFQRQKKT